MGYCWKKENPRVHGDARLLRLGVNGLSRVANNELGGLMIIKDWAPQ